LILLLRCLSVLRPSGFRWPCPLPHSPLINRLLLFAAMRGLSGGLGFSAVLPDGVPWTGLLLFRPAGSRGCKPPGGVWGGAPIQSSWSCRRHSFFGSGVREARVIHRLAVPIFQHLPDLLLIIQGGFFSKFFNKNQLLILHTHDKLGGCS